MCRPPDGPDSEVTAITQRGLSRSRLSCISLFLAAAAVTILVVPWQTPLPEVRIETFDANLITVDPRGFLKRAGSVRLDARELLLSAVPESQPTIHLLTSEVPFTAAFSVVVLSRHDDGG